MSTNYGGYMGRVLKIDLSDRSICEYPWTDEDRKLYLGGKIMGAKILYDNIQSPVDPFSPENMLIITTGPLTGTGAPSSSRFNISTISPLTNLAASSNSGGSFGIFLKKSGYDGVVISGKADKPVWVEIKEDDVLFHDAAGLWGSTTSEAQQALGDRKGRLVIGPAGENLVRYASIFSDDRACGRAGVGAVMGAKNLKAVTAYGTKSVEVSHREKLKKLNKSWVMRLKKHPFTGKQLPKLGTAGLVRTMNARGILATRNYKYGRFKDFDLVSGECLAGKYLIKNKGCITCPIQCGRVVEVEGRQVKGPELETLGLLGPNIENSSLEHIIRWNYLLDELGMDTISTGSTIGFAMELNEKGMWDNGLKFGEIDNLSQVFEDIAYRRGIGSLLAEGTKRLAQKFGGRDFAINAKGLELAAYEPRRAYGQGLGYAVSNRGGCHLNGGYLVVLEGLGLNVDPYAYKSKAQLTVMFQDLMEAISAAGNCLFTSYAVLPGFLVEKPNSRAARLANLLLKHSGFVVGMLNKLPAWVKSINLPMIPHTRALKYATGMRMSFGRFSKIGSRGYNLERLLNIRLGLTAMDDSLPSRLTDELQDPYDSRTRVPLDIMKRKYYKARGWDASGIPR